MIDRRGLAEQDDLRTDRLLLRQLGPDDFDAVWPGLADPESNRLTGTRERFTPERVREYLAGLPGRDDRADWAITLDGRYVGEVVLNDLQPDDESMNYRIALLPGGFGAGVGTEAGRAVVAHGFDRVGLHRISLSVFAFNERARRSYARIGFREEGRLRESLRWDDGWHDDILMGMLSGDQRG